MAQSVKMALVGCGGIAQAHLRGIQEHATQIEVTAAVDTDPERAGEVAEKTGGQPFTSLQDAIERTADMSHRRKFRRLNVAPMHSFERWQ